MTVIETAHPVGTVELNVGGMTCAACANRVERALNKLDGVTASVNYATERAVVTAQVRTPRGRLPRSTRPGTTRLCVTPRPMTSTPYG